MKVAVLGTGLMGTALAEALIAAGHEIMVYNRSPEKTMSLVDLGALATATPAEAIAAADATIIVVHDAQGVQDLLLSADSRVVLKGKKLLNASTTKPEEIIQLAHEVTNLGGSLAEMSIMIGADQLRSKQGQFIFGCSDVDVAFWTELLLSIGERADRAGDVGDASKAETPILLTSMFGVVTAAYAAAAALKLNISKEISEHYIPMSAPSSEYFLPNLLARNYDQVMASVDNYAFVSDAAINAAQSLGLPTRVLEDIQELFTIAAKRGLGSKDGTSIGEVLLEHELPHIE